MEATWGDIFQYFLKQGMGARAIIVGFENQIVEYLAKNARLAHDVTARVRVIYPEPNIFASHPLPSLTIKCEQLEDAPTDPDLQDIARAAHGLRTGLICVENDLVRISVAALPEPINLIVPMPSACVMELIIDVVEQRVPTAKRR